MMDKPVSFYAFEMLYWCGIREGELLALTGECGGKIVIRSHPDDVFSYPVLMPEFFVDIDTREDYAHENV